jgi:hypothetical protein
LSGSERSSSALGSLGPLLRQLAELKYRFTSVTPETSAIVGERFRGRTAQTLRDVFGWNQPFLPDILGVDVFQAMQAAEVCEPLADGASWRSKIRVASLGDALFVHSAFPTLERDAVFFGPDSYRFVRAIRQLELSATRAVDIGCGSGVGGIALALSGKVREAVVLADINDKALELSRVNAKLAGVSVEVVRSDVLSGVPGAVDLIVCNAPYLRDEGARAYRDGGGAYGGALSARIVRESLARLSRNRAGGTLLLYTGAAIVAGSDSLFALIQGDLAQSGARYSYEELDPDVFSSELLRPGYADVERIAVVLLRATVAGRGAA